MSYFVRIGGNVFGPFDEQQLLEMKAKGKIARSTEISENKHNWHTAETFAFLYIHTAPLTSQAAQSPVNELVGRFRRANVATRNATPDLELAETDAELESEPGYGSESEFTFEIRLNGKQHFVTKNKLFELARTGAVLPDDTVTIDGTKVFADSIKGIAFGETRSTASPEPESKPKTYPNFRKNNAVGPPNTSSLSATDESYFLSRPSRMGKKAVGNLGNTFQGWFSRSNTSEDHDPVLANIKYVQYTLGIVGIFCLLGVGYYFMFSENNKYGTINIEGMVTLDGQLTEGVSVILHPRDEKNGSVAGGITKKNGKFTVTTDIVVNPDDLLHGTVPMVRGVLPGEYDVTFYKLAVSNREILTVGKRSAPEYLVPQKYGDVKTSGLDPIVIAKDKKTFTFELKKENTESERLND